MPDCVDVINMKSKTAEESNVKSVVVLHFNDCYNVEPRSLEPCGGAARFKTALSILREEESLVLFSGDILSPSITSTFTKGEHMVAVLNHFRVDCAVFGNHDFDFGVDHLESVARRTSFPWLLSNVIYNETQQPLANGRLFYVLERNGVKFGFLGLVEEEWIETTAAIHPEEVTYLDFVLQGRKLAKQLKEEENVDYIVALTHMRMPNDCRLAEEVDDVDLILGGHDHVYDVRKVNEKYIVKSGSDFQQLSKICLTFNCGKVGVKIDEIEINSVDYSEDESLKKELNQYSFEIEEKLEEKVAKFECNLDGRFASIRIKETNLGNFVCDAILETLQTDLVILNSGGLRGDRIFQRGDFKLRDLTTLMALNNALTVISASGHQVWKALENGVSKWPKMEGRFPQVSGVQFVFNAAEQAGRRIDPKYVKIGTKTMDLNQKYRLATKEFLRQGNDGYSVFKECDILISDEVCPDLFTLLLTYFRSKTSLVGNTGHRLHNRRSANIHDNKTNEHPSNGIFPLLQHNGHDLSSPVTEICSLAVFDPKLEGRILLINKEARQKLADQEFDSLGY